MLLILYRKYETPNQLSSSNEIILKINSFDLGSLRLSGYPT